MWHCPNCGERIDDAFDACWKCGTAKDRTATADWRVMHGDSDVSGPQPISEPAKEIADRSNVVPAHAKDERIVELCSAADAVEAHTLRVLLEEAGIQAHVVGETLGNAAGWLPLGEAITPRVWVFEKDAACAREIIDERTDHRCQDPSATADDEEQTALDSASDEENAHRAFNARSWLGRAFTIIGLACIVLGAVWAWHAWTMVRQYAGTAEGLLVRRQMHFSSRHEPPSEIPFRRDSVTFSIWYDIQYAFVVHGKTYHSANYPCQHVVDRMPIRYDPRDPATNVVGSLTPPWMVLAVAMGIGSPLLLVGYLLGTPRGVESLCS